MAIDLRQERQQHEQGQQRQLPTEPNRSRGTSWMVAAGLIAVLTIGAALTMFALQGEPAPTGGLTLSYPEGAFTGDREGGVYVVVPEPVAGFTDTLVQIREGGGSVSETAVGPTDTPVQIREGGVYVVPVTDTSVETREG